MIIEALKRIVGPKGFLEGADISPAFHHDISGERSGFPSLVLRPASTLEVSAILRLCEGAGQPIVPQGGMTGLVSAGTPAPGEIALSLQRMNSIEDIDEAAATMTVQAGCPLQAVQEAADACGLFFPLDIGSRGTCTIGGNLSTNAGGNRVIRYGMARELTLGVEAVLADGTVLDSLNKMRKNNAGFDLKHLFIGTEGTLGVLTRAVLLLHPKPRSQLVAFCALPGFKAAISLLRLLRSELGGRLSAFEALWQNSYRLVIETVPSVRKPLQAEAPVYVLVEATGTHPAADETAFESALASALENGVVDEVVIARSLTEVHDLWAVRDGISEAVLKLNPFLSYDVSMPVGEMDVFAEFAMTRIARDWPNARVGVFGHIGDGNLHIVTNVGEDGATPRAVVDELIYGATRRARGSVSAEHGIGFQKRAWLSYSRTPEEIGLMRKLKASLDPKGILSPGRVLCP
ncbi:MAG TPA: FAD-binding oxidoreductase [Burkholderiales bacterium]